MNSGPTIAITLMVGCGILSAQDKASPAYRVLMTERTVKAISYQHRSGTTKIDFEGTALMPEVRGEATVESKQGYVAIAVELRNLGEAAQFGGEYLTYVLWGITPEGRTCNLGEILRDGSSGKLDATTELQVFGMVLTAEPYFAVARPSDVIVMQNLVLGEALGTAELIDAKYQLLQRGQYRHLANVVDLRAGPKMSLQVYEARNAIQIARSSGADKYAREAFKKAEQDLKLAEAYRSKAAVVAARMAVQTAESARAIAVKEQEADINASRPPRGSCA
jgi:hypothetical protein